MHFVETICWGCMSEIDIQLAKCAQLTFLRYILYIIFARSWRGVSQEGNWEVNKLCNTVQLDYNPGMKENAENLVKHLIKRELEFTHQNYVNIHEKLTCKSVLVDYLKKKKFST